MSAKFYATILVFLLLVSQPAFLLGQQTNDKSDWTAVQSLKAGDKLTIETKDGKRLKGSLSIASANNLELTINGKSVSFDKTNIRKVYRSEQGGSRTKSALIGTAVGAGVGGGGAAVLLAATNGSDEGSSILAAGIAIGAAAGAALGFLAGKGTKRTLVYESQ